jgi:hypothetical protein
MPSEHHRYQKLCQGDMPATVQGAARLSVPLKGNWSLAKLVRLTALSPNREVGRWDSGMVA